MTLATNQRWQGPEGPAAQNTSHLRSHKVGIPEFIEIKDSLYMSILSILYIQSISVSFYLVAVVMAI